MKKIIIFFITTIMLIGFYIIIKPDETLKEDAEEIVSSYASERLSLYQTVGETTTEITDTPTTGNWTITS